MADTAYHRLEQELTAKVLSGVLAPGERLPSLRILATRAGVSVGTAVAAYEALERKGIIESRPRSGFFVCGNSRNPAPPSAPALLPALAAPVSRSALIRQVLEALGRADLLLGLSVPSAELLPGAALARLMAQAVREAGGQALGYAPVAGLPELRRQVALRTMDAGVRLAPEEVLITSGAVEALSIALRCVTRPGDAVVIPSPTYYCLLEQLETLGLRAIELASRPGTGVDPADVAAALARFAPAAVVLIPNFNNPDGSLMPDAAKAEVAALAARAGVPIVEDDIYGELAYETGGTRRPTLVKAHAPDPGLVLSCSSFSKTLAPGLRVGWLAPGRFLDKALQLKATTTVCTATPTQLAVAEFLVRGGYDRHLRRLRGALKGQMQAMRAALGREFPAGTRVSEPTGGLQLWVELPGRVDSSAYFLRARDLGIGVCPGSLFSPSDRYRGFIRLCCGTLWDDALEAGLARLGRLAADMAAGR